MTLHLRYLALLTLSLFLCACAAEETNPDSNEPTTPQGTSSTSDSPDDSDGTLPMDNTEPTQTPGDDAPLNIVEVAQSDAEFATLVTAISAADLAETLSGEGPFTVFAPTEAAFNALEDGILDAALADPSGLLTDVLTYHVVAGKFMAEDVIELDKATTLNGTDISIEVIDGEVILNGSVKVTATDIEASNGVIHVIDGVLLPPSEPEPTLSNIVEIAQNDPSFSTLVTAVSAAGLVDTLSGEGPFTVFAPTDSAFEALDEGLLDAALADPEGLLTDVLTYHVVNGKVMAADVLELSSATTLNGADIAIEIVDGNVILNGSVMVTATDIEASNGVIHVIDAVLLPPTEAPEPTQNIVEIAQSNDDFSTLVTAVSAADLVDTLAGEGPFTVFAPTNAAFEAMDQALLTSTLEDPNGLLTDVLTYHVVSGKVMAADVVTLESATTLQGGDITIEVIEGEVILNGMVKVTATDIEATNGVIHVIDAVLLPPADAPAPTQNIVEIAQGNEDFSTLVTAVSAAGLVETLSGEGPFTVFAPTNAAFEAMDQALLNSALADPTGLLTDVLTYHVVSGKVMAEEVVNLEAATTLNGGDITIEVVEGEVILNGIVKVTATDIEATNGVIHIIDAVLLPSN